MKKYLSLIFALVFLFIFASCGSNEAKTTDDSDNKQNSKTVITDTASEGGYTVKIVAAHKTVDSNGDPIAAIEFLFKNENDTPVSFSSGIAVVNVFQDNVECMNDAMYLERNFDWDTNYTDIKGGAEISVYSAYPLSNETSPVEVNVKLYDYEGNNYSEAAATLDLVD